MFLLKQNTATVAVDRAARTQAFIPEELQVWVMWRIYRWPCSSLDIKDALFLSSFLHLCLSISGLRANVTHKTITGFFAPAVVVHSGRAHAGAFSQVVYGPWYCVFVFFMMLRTARQSCCGMSSHRGTSKLPPGKDPKLQHKTTCERPARSRKVRKFWWAFLSLSSSQSKHCRS